MTNLNDKKLKRKIAQKGICPACGSKHIEYGSFGDFENPSEDIFAECKDCKTSWWEQFEIIFKSQWIISSNVADCMENDLFEVENYSEIQKLIEKSKRFY